MCSCLKLFHTQKIEEMSANNRNNRIDISVIRELIYQTKPRNEFVMLEYDLAEFLQVPVSRLHMKIEAQTDLFPTGELCEITDDEFEYIKRIRKYKKERTKGRYCYIFTEEQIGLMQSLFNSREMAYKIIPTIMLAFESITIDYPSKIKEIILEKRREIRIRYILLVILAFIVYIFLLLLIHLYINNGGLLVKALLAFIGLIIPAISIFVPRDKLFQWNNQEQIEKEYQAFYENLYV